MADFTDADRTLLQRLADESAVRNVLATYANAVDWLDWKTLESTFWSDAYIDLGLYKGDTAGFLPVVKALEEGYTRRMHLFGEARIVVAGVEAGAEAAAITHVRTANEQGRFDDIIRGRYLVEFRKRGAEWRISRVQFVLNEFNRYDSPVEPEGLPLETADAFTVYKRARTRF